MTAIDPPAPPDHCRSQAITVTARLIPETNGIVLYEIGQHRAARSGELLITNRSAA